MAALLTSKGFKVNLCDLPQFYDANIKPFQERGGIEVTGDSFNGFFELNTITTNIAEAVKGVNIVIVMSRAQGHMPLIESCLTSLEDGQVLVIYTPFFTALRAADRLRERGLRNVVLGEVQILPWSCNRTGPTTAYLRATKSELLAAAMPAENTHSLLSTLEKLPSPPRYVRAANVLETTLGNIMPALVVPIPLLNIGMLENTKVSLYYEHGLTPPVGRVVDSLDSERMAVGRALGLKLESLAQSMSKWYSRYGCRGESSFEVFDTLWTHEWEVPATTLRYEMERGELAESIPYFLVPLSHLGHLLGVPTPATDTIIHLAELITGINYRREGLTLEQIGVAGLTKEQMISYANTGQRRSR